MTRVPRFLPPLLLLSLVAAFGCASAPEPPAATAGTIEGTVTDADGDPVSGLTVFITDGSSAFPDVAAMTSSEGRYWLGRVPVGTFDVAVYDETSQLLDVKSVDVAGGAVSTLDFAITGTINVAGMSQDEFEALLTIDDIRDAVSGEMDLAATFHDLEETARSIDPIQFQEIESFQSLTYEPPDGDRGVTLTVIDFTTADAAQSHYALLRSSESGGSDMASPVGEASMSFAANADGTGTVIVFLKGDRTIQLRTTGEDPLVDSATLETLARTVAGRL